jgi:ADP-heptose:LPS heptosyltransferase
MLVLRALDPADFLVAVPALRALKRARPDHRLVLAAPVSVAPLAAFSRAVDLIHPTDRVADFVPPACDADIAVNLHGRGPQSHRALASTAPREFLGFGCPGIEYAGPEWRDDEHVVHRWCRLVAEGWGVETDPVDLALARPDRDSVAPGAVVIHPGAPDPSRRWPVERFAEVARRLCEAGHPVVITGSPAEASLARQVRVRAGLPDGSDLAGRTDLAGRAALVAGARLVISGDSEVAHLASAYRTPSVVLFGPTPPSQSGPPAGGPHVPIWHGTGVPEPRVGDVDPALLRIQVDEVLAEAARLLTLTSAGPEWNR